MNTVFVLIVVFVQYKGALGIINQEFSSNERCEAARKEIVMERNTEYVKVHVNGCFKK